MNKILFLIFSLSTHILANNVVSSLKIASTTNEVFYSKNLINITQKDLSLFSKNDNIQNLFDKALNENRIAYNKFDSIKTYNNLENGDFLLLKCLKEIDCDIETFAKIMQKSQLHQKIAYDYPSISIGKLNQIVGSINENLMNRYFISSNWIKIEGEVGRNGIDGLFIKRDTNGFIRDLLIVESKYNKSGLQDTEHGQQMTKQWILKKLLNLKNKYPDNSDYIQIEKFVNNDIYRAMLWNLKAENDVLIFDLSKLNDKNGKVEKISLISGEKFKINQSNNSYININNPENDFHRNIIEWYKKEFERIEEVLK